MSAIVQRPREQSPDPICGAAVDLALAAVQQEAGPDAVGDLIATTGDEQRTATHSFACHLAGYHGWQWQVILARGPRSRRVTINDVSLVPGDEALLAPAWLPWTDRLEPGDMSPGTVVDTPADDPRLSPGISGADELAGELDPGPLHPVNWEPGLGRRRVPSAYGRERAARRWRQGPGGPRNQTTRAAPGHCGECGWLLTIGGPMGQEFGICSNQLAETDGRVVTFDHGCGGFSEATSPSSTSRVETILDEVSVDDWTQD